MYILCFGFIVLAKKTRQNEVCGGLPAVDLSFVTPLTMDNAVIFGAVIFGVESWGGGGWGELLLLLLYSIIKIEAGTCIVGARMQVL